MLTHKMKLARDPFEKMIRGQKLIESRMYDEKRRQINEEKQRYGVLGIKIELLK